VSGGDLLVGLFDVLIPRDGIQYSPPSECVVPTSPTGIQSSLLSYSSRGSGQRHHVSRHSRPTQR
jgi:hypothetical protein